MPLLGLYYVRIIINKDKHCRILTIRYSHMHMVTSKNATLGLKNNMFWLYLHFLLQNKIEILLSYNK